jgi:hypothetical protein
MSLIIPDDNQKDESPKMELIKEYYVYYDFGNSTDYLITENMIYTQYNAYFMQERGDEKENLATSFSTNVGDIFPTWYPMESNHSLIFNIEKDEYVPFHKRKREAVILPEFSSPNYSILGQDRQDSPSNEFFWYSK